MRTSLESYVELTKPKVTLLNLLVGVTCFVLAAYPRVNLLGLLEFSALGYLAAGGCAVINCVYDQDTDKLMPRTAKRAIPSGKVASKSALIYGSAMLILALTISWLGFNILTTAMVFLGIVFYLVVYTVWLKRSSAWNVVIGGVAGCFAGLAGWTAVTNSLGLIPLIIVAIDFLWTPGHLWGLAIKKVKEYQAAAIPMLPVEVGLEKTALVMLLFNIATVVSAFLIPLLGGAGVPFTLIAVLSSSLFLFETLKLTVFPNEQQGFRVFLTSMPYLACLMIGLIADKVLASI